MNRLTLVLVVLLGITLTAFTPYEKGESVNIKENVITEKLSLDYTYNLTKRITVKHMDDYITDYIRIQDIMKANPDRMYITGEETNLNPTGCPPDCSPTHDFNLCYYTYTTFCGQDNQLQCWVCVYPVEYPEWRKCAVCHW